MNDPIEDELATRTALPDVGQLTGHERLKNLLRQQLFGGGTPDKIARFEIRRQLGAGAMGVVYAAYDQELDREVAIKLIRSSIQHSPEGRTRLRREARAMARLAHPNVVPVYEIGDHEGQLFVVMELIPGETLRNWQQRQDRSWRDILAMYLHVGQGLAAAHAQNIVHRDFKPDNVLVGRDSRPRVVDFGLAHSLDPEPDATPSDEPGAAESESGRSQVGDEPGDEPTGDEAGAKADEPATATLAERLTRTGAMMGTIAYMAPEQFLGQATDQRTDQFSFCIALWEALHGERPFRGRNLQAVAAAVTQGRLEAAPPGGRLPAWLRTILTRGLAVSPGERFADMDELLQQLGRDRRRRRRLLSGALALMVVGAGIGVAAGSMRSAVSPCQALDRPMVEIWNPARADAISARFSATGLPYANSVWASARTALDAHADQWKSLRAHACRASLVERSQSEELYDLQDACLQRQRTTLAAVLQQFERADTRTVERAYDAVHSLPDASVCGDVELLRLGMEPPTPGQASEVIAIRSRLANAHALRLAGDYPSALRIALEIASDARPLGYQPVLAEALLEVGSIHEGLGDGQASVAALLEAVDVGESSRHDLLTARTWSRLVAVAALHTKRPVAGRDWFRRARSAVVRLGGAQEQPALMASVHQGLGLVNFLAESYDDAETEHRRALDLLARHFGPEHLEVARVLDNLANTLQMRGRSQEAQELYRRALAIRTDLLGAEHPEVSRQWFNIGWSYFQRRDFPQARVHYERALAGYRKTQGPDSRRLAETLLAVAQVDLQQAAYERAAERLRAAEDIFQRVLPEDHPTRGKAANTRATVLFYQQRYEQALAHYRRALTIYRSSREPRLEDIAMAEVNSGESLAALGRLKEAIPHFSRAHDGFVQTHGPTHTYVAYTLVHLGNAHLGLEQPADAISPLERASAIYGGTAGQEAALADASFALARALAGASAPRTRARTTALRAQSLYRELGAGKRDQLAQVESWLARHP